LLDIGVGDPIADVCRALTDSLGRIVYYAHIRYPARLIEIEIDLMRRYSRAAKNDKTKIIPAPGRVREGNGHGRRKAHASDR
jgi:hypothetical protein